MASASRPSPARREVVSAIVRRMAVSFIKRDFGSGRETWREVQMRNHRIGIGPSRITIRRISNKIAKRRELSGDICLY